jgi:hypothetical protein
MTVVVTAANDLSEARIKRLIKDLGNPSSLPKLDKKVISIS